jgi:hypothetical protein
MPKNISDQKIEDALEIRNQLLSSQRYFESNNYDEQEIEHLEDTKRSREHLLAITNEKIELVEQIFNTLGIKF